MSKVTLVRHGQTYANKEFCFVGQSENAESKLTDEGKQMAADVHKLLKDQRFDAVYCSPSVRTMQTAKIVLEGHDLEIITDKRLMEVDFGTLDGKSIKEQFEPGSKDVLNWWTDFWETPFPSGESLGQLSGRINDFGLELSKKDGDNILIITHANPIKMILSIMTKEDAKSMLAMPIPICSVFVAEKNAEDTWTYEQVHPK